jgi:hypothetical protein
MLYDIRNPLLLSGFSESAKDALKRHFFIDEESDYEFDSLETDQYQPLAATAYKYIKNATVDTNFFTSKHVTDINTVEKHAKYIISTYDALGNKDSDHFENNERLREMLLANTNYKYQTLFTAYTEYNEYKDIPEFKNNLESALNDFKDHVSPIFEHSDTSFFTFGDTLSAIKANHAPAAILRGPNKTSKDFLDNLNTSLANTISTLKSITSANQDRYQKLSDNHEEVGKNLSSLILGITNPNIPAHNAPGYSSAEIQVFKDSHNKFMNDTLDDEIRLGNITAKDKKDYLDDLPGRINRVVTQASKYSTSARNHQLKKFTNTLDDALLSYERIQYRLNEYIKTTPTEFYNHPRYSKTLEDFASEFNDVQRLIEESMLAPSHSTKSSLRDSLSFDSSTSIGAFNTFNKIFANKAANIATSVARSFAFSTILSFIGIAAVTALMTPAVAISIPSLAIAALGFGLKTAISKPFVMLAEELFGATKNPKWFSKDSPFYNLFDTKEYFDSHPKVKFVFSSILWTATAGYVRSPILDIGAEKAISSGSEWMTEFFALPDNYSKLSQGIMAIPGFEQLSFISGKLGVQVENFIEAALIEKHKVFRNMWKQLTFRMSHKGYSLTDLKTKFKDWDSSAKSLDIIRKDLQSFSADLIKDIHKFIEDVRQTPGFYASHLTDELISKINDFSHSISSFISNISTDTIQVGIAKVHDEIDTLFATIINIFSVPLELAAQKVSTLAILDGNIKSTTPINTIPQLISYSGVKLANGFTRIKSESALALKPEPC